MTKFGDAFQRGQEAHFNAERAKQEIEQVLTEMSAAVLASTDGLVRIVHGRLTNSKLVGPVVSHSLWSMLAGGEAYGALYIQLRDRAPVELCSIKTTPNGYPVTLQFVGHSIAAEDKPSLEEALMKLLEHPDIAGRIVQSKTVAEKLLSESSQKSEPDANGDGSET